MDDGTDRSSAPDESGTECKERENSELYRLIAEHALDVVWVLDMDAGRFLYVSPSVERLRGWTPDEVISQPLSAALTPESYAQVRAALSERLPALTPGREHEYVNCDRVEQPCKGGGTVWTEVTTRARRNTDTGRLEIIGVSRDITERKRAEDALAQLTAELERRVLDRTSELESFAYSISHDLRAPLRAMNGFARILAEDYADSLDDQGQHYLRRVQESALRMSRLIDDLLAFSRLGRQVMSVSPVDLTLLARRAADEQIAQNPERAIDFTVDELPRAWGDPSMLAQVFANLIGNAVKYTRPRARASVRVSCENTDGEDVLSVTDNGVGFDMRYAGKLFGVFQRMHSEDEFEGTGVGLALVRRIVERHNGRIWVEAEPDKGAAFRFTLKLPPSAEAEPVEA